MADRDATFDIIANDKTAKGITTAANRFDRFNKRIQDKANDWGKFGDTAGKRFAGKALAALAKIADIGMSIGTKLMSGIGAAASIGGPVVQAAVAAALIAAVIAAAPVIAAGVSSAILLGVGGGVLALGIKAAANSPAVKAAWKGFGDRAKNAFKDFGKPFEGPVIRAAQTFGDALERMAPTLNGMGKTLAPVIDKLAPALAKMAENALPGIAKAAEASKPIFDKLAEVLPKLGTYIGRFFELISKGGPESSQLIGDIVNIVGLVILQLGSTILALTKMYGWARTVWVAVGGFIKTAVQVGLTALGMLVSGAAKAFGWIPGIGPKLTKAAEEFNKFKNKVNNYLNGIQDEQVTVSVAMRVTGNSNSSAVAAALRKQNLTAVLSRYSSFAAAGNDGYRSRTGGPAPVEVSNNVSVSLDGAPFYAMTATAVRSSERRQAFNAKVGRRF